MLVKLVTPPLQATHPLPPQTKLKFEMSAFCPQHCWGGGGGINLKPIKKLSLGAESYVSITWKGFFTQSQVILSTIVNKIVSQYRGTYLYSS